MPRLNRNEIEEAFEESIMPQPLSNDQLNALRKVSSQLGRGLSDAERNAVLYPTLPQQLSMGIQIQQNKYAEAEHLALRERLLALN
jgi:hypothetical protein